MTEMLNHIFAAVCGQNVDHTWAPGGVWLPVCQRCTGLYAGAGIALLLHLVLRPTCGRSFLWMHGAFLLLMAPFGFHWIPQGPALRAASGVLFGFGVLTFLWLPLSRFFPAHRVPREQLTQPLGTREAAYLAAILTALYLVPLLGNSATMWTHATLVVLICWGAAALGLTIVADLGLALTAAGPKSSPRTIL